MFFIEFLKSSMSCLIKHIKNYFHTFVTNQPRYHMTNFEKCGTKPVRADPKYVEFQLFWS